jgi:hypothetical protein
MAKALHQRHANRKGRHIRDQTARERKVKRAHDRGQRKPHRNGDQTADQNILTLRKQDIDQPEEDAGPAETGNVATSAPITGPARSAMKEADTTKAAATAMRNPSNRVKLSSEGMDRVLALPRRGSARKTHTRFIETETLGPFLMV